MRYAPVTKYREGQEFPTPPLPVQVEENYLTFQRDGIGTIHAAVTNQGGFLGLWLRRSDIVDILPSVKYQPMGKNSRDFKASAYINDIAMSVFLTLSAEKCKDDLKRWLYYEIYPTMLQYKLEYFNHDVDSD